jgi:transaldolase
MKDGYFHRVHRLSPTKFWVNNPTSREVRLALEAGALGCTNNPSCSFKMLEHPEESSRALELLKACVAETASDDEAAAAFQRKLVAPVAEAFRPLWERSGGADGWVSIQGDPVHEHDPEVIVREAHENGRLGPNVNIKIPCTRAGLEAMKTLIPAGYAINATEIMSVSQGVALCEMYERVSRECGKRPPLFLSFIAGIYDEYLETQVREQKIPIEKDLVHQAGLAATRKMYRLLHDRRWPAVIIGGGARHLRHFTEMVGGDQVVTINWKGTADLLLEQDPDVVHRFFCPVPPGVIDELLAKLPDFRRGWEPGALAVDEYEGFGPVVLFRSMFLKSWNGTLAKIRQLRGR